MTLRDFNGLSERVKTEVVELWGNLITDKVIPGFRVKVYRVYDFFVEVYYSVKDDQVTKHRACIRKETVVG